MTQEFKPGDRVSIEGTVDFAGKNVVDVVVGHPSGARQYITVAPDAPTLLARPAPPLPTEPGTTGTAVVRGVPGVRVMRLGGQPWRLSFWVSVSPVAGASLHPDSDLAEFEPDPDTRTHCEASGYSRYVCQAIDLCDCFEPRVVPDPQPALVQDDPATPEPPQTDLCVCGHERGEHNYGHWVCITKATDCTCRVYLPATPSTEETR